MVHRIVISRLIQLQNNLKGLNKLPRIKEELSNSKIAKIKAALQKVAVQIAVLLILRIVAVLLILQIVAVLLILQIVAVQIQATLHLPTQPNKTKLKIKPHLPQITGSCKISHIYKMIQ